MALRNLAQFAWAATKKAGTPCYYGSTSFLVMMNDVKNNELDKVSDGEGKSDEVVDFEDESSEVFDV